jgi:hypothetical protein
MVCRVVWKNFLEGNLMANLRLRPSEGGSNLSPEKIAQVRPFKNYLLSS